MTATVTKDRILRLAEMLDAARCISIITHTRPDGDAMGSCIAMHSFIRSRCGVSTSILVANAWSESLDFIIDDSDRADIVLHDSEGSRADACLAASDLIICLDCSGFSRTETLQDAARASSAKKILIDHHLSPCVEEFDLCFSETEISSASELLFWILLSMPGIDGEASRLPMHALVALMTGMTTDTNNFANSVFPETLQMASILLSAGVDRDFILSELYNRGRENRLRMIGYILKDKLTILPCGASYFILTKEEIEAYDIREGELEGVVNLPLGADEVRMSISMKEDDGFFRVSIRSKKGTSANLFAREHFNGGGHEQAAGGRLYFPRDISDRSDAADYVEKVSTQFLANK